MEKFTTHTGIGVPLPASNVDTDQIIPAQFLKRITRTGFDDALFARWREDEDFVLNIEPYSCGSVLVAGPDFGTGSSREHAVWALRDYGFRAVLSARFADIFRSNAGKQGLVAAQLRPEDITRIMTVLTESPGTEVTVDLEAQTVACEGVEVPFQIDPETRARILQGQDEIAVTLAQQEAISRFERGRPAWLPRTLPR